MVLNYYAFTKHRTLFNLGLHMVYLLLRLAGRTLLAVIVALAGQHPLGCCSDVLAHWQKILMHTAASSG